MKSILVTGGAGYIGSHTVVELLNSNHEVVIVDNFVNSNPEALNRIKKISNKDFKFYELDVCDKQALSEIFSQNKIDAVIHFAGLKAVGESVETPIRYYQNNLISTLALLQCMDEHSVKQLVFSSSATVYGNPKTVPIKETDPIGDALTNPYGKTKYMIEEILMDLNNTNNNWQLTSLRYFNPAGAHESGLIGEDPNDTPNNLMPYISQVAVGKLKELSIFGNDYPTKDGTGVRDYIHVVDLAKAHVSAIDKPAKTNEYRAINIGTGRGTSVLELINAFQETNQVNIPHKISPRRLGDVAICYADTGIAKKELNWQAEKSINDMCQDSWAWQSKNPNGYSS